MSSELHVDEVNWKVEDDELIVEIGVTNTLDRTVHAHVTPRKIHYDPDTRALAIELTDENLQRDLLLTHQVLPKFKAVDPNASSILRVRLPRLMHRLGASSSSPSPTIETLPIHEATDVDVAIAWSDTPFYPDPREKSSGPLDDMAKWQRGTATGSGHHGESTAKPRARRANTPRKPKPKPNAEKPPNQQSKRRPKK